VEPILCRRPVLWDPVFREIAAEHAAEAVQRKEWLEEALRNGWTSAVDVGTAAGASRA
jgi:hypothetical protein